MRTSFFPAICLALVLVCVAPPSTAFCEGKIRLFENGSFYLAAGRSAKNMLVSGDAIAGLDVDPELWPGAERVDLAGGFVYPGFTDSHAHLLETGYFFYVGVNLIGCANVDDIVRIVERKVTTLPEGAVLLGGGFSLRDYDGWTLADLARIDAVTGNHPAFLGDKLGHNAIINSRAIELIGLTPTSAVPRGGRMGVERGRVTGMLRESAMILPWTELSRQCRLEDIKAGTLGMLNTWAAFGYTAIIDLMGATGMRMNWPEVFYELEREGRLPVRVNFCYTLFNLGDLDEAVKYKGRDSDLVRFTGGKIFVDGAYAGGQAWTSWANRQGGHGLAEIFTDDSGGPGLNLNRIVAKAEEYGLDMHYHAQGDLAIGAVLDALDAVRAKAGRIAGLHTLIHCAFPTEAQIERIRGFGGHVVATMQPGFWPVENDTEYYYGDRALKAYPVRTMIDSGIVVGISTDFSVSPPEYSPATVVIGVAATGKTDTGRLQVGFKADFSVFDENMLALAPSDFTASRPRLLASYVGGRKVFQRK